VSRTVADHALSNALASHSRFIATEQAGIITGFKRTDQNLTEETDGFVSPIVNALEGSAASPQTRDK
jgi:hypothetical protein